MRRTLQTSWHWFGMRPFWWITISQTLIPIEIRFVLVFSLGFPWCFIVKNGYLVPWGPVVWIPTGSPKLKGMPLLYGNLQNPKPLGPKPPISRWEHPSAQKGKLQEHNTKSWSAWNSTLKNYESINTKSLNKQFQLDSATFFWLTTQLYRPEICKKGYLKNM